MFKKRCEQAELIDDFAQGNDTLVQSLHEIDVFNRYFGSQAAVINGLNKIYKRYKRYVKQQSVTIADLGCGSGALLSVINQWAVSHKLEVTLIGVDANAYTIAHAKSNTAQYSNIQYRTLDIFSQEFAAMTFDIVTLNTVCHHFSDDQLTKLFKQLTKQTRFAVMVNDLHRHRFSYYAVKFIATLFSKSSMVQNDGPISVLKGFHKSELVRILRQANIKHFKITRRWAFRWQLILWCAS